jgi:hypothetical protein
MIKSFAADRSLVSIRDLPGLPLSEEQICPAVLMPFEPNTEEARNLQGALGFLFTLIAFYDELIEQNVPANSDAA